MKRHIHLKMPEDDHGLITQNALEWFKRSNNVPEDIKKLSPKDSHSMSRIRIAFVLSLATNYNTNDPEQRYRNTIRLHEEKDAKTSKELERVQAKLEKTKGQLAEVTASRDAMDGMYTERGVRVEALAQKVSMHKEQFDYVYNLLIQVPKWVRRVFGIQYDPYELMERLTEINNEHESSMEEE